MWLHSLLVLVMMYILMVTETSAVTGPNHFRQVNLCPEDLRVVENVVVC